MTMSGLRSYIIIFERLSLAYIELYKKTLKIHPSKDPTTDCVCSNIIVRERSNTDTSKAVFSDLSDWRPAREMY